MALLAAALACVQCSDPVAEGSDAGDLACCPIPIYDTSIHFDTSPGVDSTKPSDAAGSDLAVPADTSALPDAHPADTAGTDASASDVTAGPDCGPTPKAESCNGQDDDCDGKTDNGACDDGNACTTDSCKASSGACSHTAKAGPCDDGNPCTVSDKCSGASCAAGDAASCDDNNACTKDSCDPIAGCKSVPIATASACSDDGDPCTDDLCDAGTCTHPVAAGHCKIGGACVLAGAASPDNPCLFCDPAVTPSQYAPKDGALCDDGNPCTVADTCQVAQCKGGPKPCGALDSSCSIGTCDPVSGGCVASPKPAGTACDDGNPCTTQDQCDASGTCAAKPLSCTTLDDACHTGVCSGGQCLKQEKSAGTACSDGDACTQGDTCKAGVCTGPTMDCSAKTDACHLGICSAGACTTQNKPNGTPCNDKSSCTSNDICGSGTCSGTPLKDSYEANNSGGAAATLAIKSDCDNESSLTASLSPAGDSDWYTFEVTDDTFCTIKPNATIDNLSADFDVCVYFVCAGKSAASDQVGCANGTKTGGTGPGGAYGCCSNSSGSQAEFAKIDPSCSFLGTGSESGTAWVQVTAKNAAVCGDYKLVWAAKDLP